MISRAWHVGIHRSTSCAWSLRHSEATATVCRPRPPFRCADLGPPVGSLGLGRGRLGRGRCSNSVKVGDTTTRALFIYNESELPALFQFIVEENGIFGFSRYEGVIPAKLEVVGRRSSVVGGSRSIIKQCAATHTRPNAMRCDAVRCDACDALQCDAMHCNAMQCDALQCNAVRCDALQCNAMDRNGAQVHIKPVWSTMDVR